MKKKVKIINIVMLLSIVALLPKSNAALVSKSGTSALVNTTVSNSYLLCQGMKGVGESLYGSGSNVQPHLATNKDWGAVSYLSNSIYGTNTKGGNNGLTVSINGTNYYSTNGNTSGVMNWGTKYTQTAGLINNCTSGNDNIMELYNNRNTKYVEYIDARSEANTKGMSTNEIKGIYDSTYGSGIDTNFPCSTRFGLFGYRFGDSSGGIGTYISGKAFPNVTFRPVVWN